MAVLVVADDPHVYPVSLLRVQKTLRDERWSTGVKGLRRCPSTRVADVRVGGVCCIAVLVNEVPQFLGRKVKDLRRCAVFSADG